jgi:hypothetical protein
VAHNSNLSIKAIEALAAYADLAHLLKHDDVAKEYSAMARTMADKWVGMAAEGDHYKLAFNSPGTWSQKYNLVWDGRFSGLTCSPKRSRNGAGLLPEADQPLRPAPRQPRRLHQARLVHLDGHSCIRPRSSSTPSSIPSILVK